MISPKAKMLSNRDKEYIHSKALDLLKNVGIQFNSSKALAILADAGCQIDGDKQVAKIPSELVEKSLKTLPSNFKMCALDPTNDFMCGDGQLYYTAPGQCIWFRDLETRQRRLATLDDLVTCNMLIEEMDEIQEWAPMVLPGDVDPSMQTLRVYQAALKQTTKHLLAGAEQISDVPYILQLMDVILGDRNFLKERPILSIVINPSSPLKNGGQLVDIILEFAPYKLPIFMQFLPLAGATSPVTLAGTVVQETAAFLGNMVLYQTAAPGWPIIWALATGVLDMKSGRFAGGPESVMMTFSLLEMSKYYGVPSNSFGSSSSEATYVGYKNGMEAMFGLVMFGALGGVDNFWWPADMDGFNLMDLANVILAKEPVRQIDRLKRGMILDDEYTMLETMIKVGHEGKYLSEASTRKYFKREHLLPDLFPRDTIEAWEARNETEDDIALVRINEMLSVHEPKEMPPEIEKEIDKIVDAAEKAYSE
jgi:trimethylamine--corrinoid protein Co-methyltransferase